MKFRASSIHFMKVMLAVYYDLIWYMQKGIMPNAKRLADAEQHYSIQSAFDGLHQKIENDSIDL